MRGGNNHKISPSELVILKYLGHSVTITRERRTTEITEISTTTGIRDNDEVLRALYTLEGKNLVEPEPRGDFTSNRWQITDVGLRALQVFAA
jgi:hypothetical protein